MKIPSSRSDADRRIRQSDRIARIFRVLQLIQGRGRWNTKEIAAEIECSERTVYRDLQVLEMAGVPYYFAEEENCYRIRPGWQFPVMGLTSDELVGQAIATSITKAPGLEIARETKATTNKLAAHSSDEAAAMLSEAGQLISVLDLKLADHTNHQDMLKTIQWALLERKQLVGQYASPYQEKPVKLTLHPFRLCLIKQAWYLIARANDKDTPRTYRATRFKSARVLAAAADIPDDFSLHDYFGNAWGVYRGPETHEVEIEFTKDGAPLVAETNWHTTQKVKQHKDGRATLSFTVDGLDEIVWWVCGWAGRAKVIKPEKLREMVSEKHRSALALNEPT